jgi:glucose-1-phosphate thymidylyltransferase
MKALILCAGRATRLRPLTYSLAKHLIPVANTPVLFSVLTNIVDAGATDIGIVVNADNRSGIAAAIGDGARFGARVSYIEQPQPLGLAHAVACARDFIGDDPFLLYLGDTLISERLIGLTTLFRSARPSAAVMLAPVHDPQRYGVAEVQANRIVRLAEKSSQPPSNLAIIGAYVFDPHIFEVIDRLQPSARGEYEITDAIQTLVTRGLIVQPFVVSSWWKDTGSPADLLEANVYALDEMTSDIRGTVDATSTVAGTAVIAAGAMIRHSRIVGPVAIGADAMIEAATIGPYVALGDRTWVHYSSIARSIVMEGTSIREVDAQISDSLIGRNVTITGASSPSHHLRLLVADDSRVEIV